MNIDQYNREVEAALVRATRSATPQEVWLDDIRRIAAMRRDLLVLRNKRGASGSLVDLLFGK